MLHDTAKNKNKWKETNTLMLYHAWHMEQKSDPDFASPAPSCPPPTALYSDHRYTQGLATLHYLQALVPLLGLFFPPHFTF